MGTLLRAYLLLLATLTILSCVGLLFLPEQLGALTPWGAAAGWQREIAFWNLSMYIVIVRTLRRKDAGAARLLALALVVLNCLVAANHFATVVKSSGGQLNAIAGAVNAGCALLGVVALWRERITDVAAATTHRSRE
jgi:KinB signaling pathway activation protein